MNKNPRKLALPVHLGPMTTITISVVSPVGDVRVKFTCSEDPDYRKAIEKLSVILASQLSGALTWEWAEKNFGENHLNIKINDEDRGMMEITKEQVAKIRENWNTVSPYDVEDYAEMGELFAAIEERDTEVERLISAVKALTLEASDERAARMDAELKMERLRLELGMVKMENERLVVEAELEQLTHQRSQ